MQIDYKICSWVCFMFFALQLDRGNISQALSDNMLSESARWLCVMCKMLMQAIHLDDLHLTTNNYNYGMTIFYVSFLAAELPSYVFCSTVALQKFD